MGFAHIWLASASPRRRLLLEQIGVCYHIVPAVVNEERQADERPEDYVIRLALAKAREGGRHAAHAHWPVLGADTAVVLDDQVLGKPLDRAQGLAMLARLSGRTHRVLSAVAVAGNGREAARLSVSSVGFRVLSEAERERYWVTGEGVDKAGGYAIQGRAAAFIAHLAGSYSGVVGLPLYETAQLLAESGIDVLQT